MRHFFNFIIVIAILILSGIIINDRFFPKKKVPQKKVDLKVINPSDLLSKKIVLPMEFVNTTATSSVCTLFLKMSAEKSLPEFKNDIVNHLADKIIETCSGALPKKLDKALSTMINECKDATPDHIASNCNEAIIRSKNQIISTIIKPDAPMDRLPSTIILHLLANSYDEGSLYDSPEKNIDQLDTLLVLEPNFLEGLKLKLLLIANSSLAKKPYYQEIFQKTLSQALDLTSTPREFLEIEIVMRGDIFTSNNENKIPSSDLIEFLDHRTLENPKEWIYLYYRAYAHFLSGREHYQECLKSLQKALSLAPNEERLKTTLSKLNAQDELKKESPFYIDTKFTLAY
jgi:hypothetical protein